MQGRRGRLAKARDELAARVETLKRELASARYELDVAAQELQSVNNELASLRAERRTTENAAAQLELLRRASPATARRGRKRWQIWKPGPRAPGTSSRCVRSA